MDLAAPYADLLTGLEGPVLEVLAGTTRPLTGRQVQRLVRRGGVPGVAATLSRLVESGLVLAEPAGRAMLYRANRDHLAWPVVEAAVGLRLALLRRISDDISGWQVRPLRAILFGSAARRDGGPDSDIDILLVRDVDLSDEWMAQVDGLADRIKGWTGNEVQVIDVESRTWEQMVDESDPLVASVDAEGIDLLSPSWAVSA